MKVTLIQIDKTTDHYLNEGIEIYLKRIKNYTAFELTTINVPKAVRMRPEAEQKKEESKLIQKIIKENDYLVLLDEGGKLLNSVDFSRFLEKKALENVKNLVFLIGGPYGFDSSIYERVLAEEQGIDWYAVKGLPEETHAIHGGGLPLNVKGMGCVGILLISGLPQVQDHLLGVEVLTEFLARKGELR